MAKMDELRKKILKHEEELKKAKEALKREEEAGFTKLGAEAAKFLIGAIDYENFKLSAIDLGFEVQ